MAGASVKTRGPDFICVGMQKAATRTLYDVLSFDLRYWMPLVKEFHHFSRGAIAIRHEPFFPLIEVLEEGGERLAQENARRRRKRQRPLDDNDLGFLIKAREYLANGCANSDYLDLFSVKPEGKVAGDITPPYSRLAPEVAAGVAELLPDVKIVLIIRDPIARTWSMINMILTRKLGLRKKSFNEDAAQEMRDALRSSGIVEELVRERPIGSFPSRIYKLWTGAVGQDAVLVLSFDDVTRFSHGVADAIFDFVTSPRGQTMPLISRPGTEQSPAPNRKKGAPRIPMDERSRELLVECFSDEIRLCRGMFGEKSEGWAAKHGIEL